jgi:hypothetical protein
MGPKTFGVEVDTEPPDPFLSFFPVVKTFYDRKNSLDNLPLSSIKWGHKIEKVFVLEKQAESLPSGLCPGEDVVDPAWNQRKEVIEDPVAIGGS